MKNIPALLILFLFSVISAMAQVGINTDNSAPDPSAGLDVRFTNKGFLPPRVALTTINFALPVVNPATGLLVYNTNVAGTPPDNVIAGYYQWDGTKWVAVSPPPGENVGDMQYWNGVQWVSLPVGSNGQILTLTNGLPAWGYPSSPCGSSITINHLAGVVAPVSKTVTYGTIKNIPGEVTKCWTTSNLGADHQATSDGDATEASAGWYWQFNRKQGFKHDGSVRTPRTTWISSISEISDWTTANDPCNIELGATWRIPTYSEWFNVDNAGGWNEWNGPWNSALKLHAAGSLDYSDGSLSYRGVFGNYWSSTQTDAIAGWFLYFYSVVCDPYTFEKSNGYSLRCIREY